MLNEKDRRYQLNEYLKAFLPNVYFQPPANIRMIYPCIVYSKSQRQTLYASDDIYQGRQLYSVTVITKNPDSPIPLELEHAFQYATIQNYLVVEGLHQTTLRIYY